MDKSLKEIVIEFSPCHERTFIAIERIGEERVGELTSYGLKNFAWITGFSGFLTRFLIQNPNEIFSLNEIKISGVEVEEHLKRMKNEIKNTDEAIIKVTKYKYKELLRIAVLERETEEHDYLRVLSELSSLYESIILFVYDMVRGNEFPFYIYALGKLGSREVNLSSDVDLMFVSDSYTQEEEKVARQFINLLTTKREYGFLMRVDTDIRPYGKFGPLISSVSSAVDYYLTRGQTWERYALLRMRPLTQRNEEFERAIEYFVFRKFLDWTTIDEMAFLKDELEKEGVEKEKEWNIKIGSGGIREIEFFVQTLQIIYGGRFKSLRKKDISVLNEMVKEEILSKKTAEELNSSYLFLRRLENMLQWEEEIRVHSLSFEDKEISLISKKMRMDKKEFLDKIASVRSNVSDLFDGLFKKFTRSGEIETSNLPSKDAEILEKFLREFKEKNPPNIYQRVKKIFEYALKEMRGREGHSCALNAFIDLISSLKMPSYLYFLSECPQAVQLIFDMLSKSPFIGSFLKKNPWFMESLIQPAFSEEEFTENFLREELQNRIEKAADLEEFLEVMVRFKNEWTFEILREDLLKGIRLQEVFLKLSILADVLMRCCMGISRAISEKEKNFVQSIKEIEEIPLLLVGMGKYGGMELNYYSDVDMIFLYEGESLHERVLKIVQKFISILSTPTGEGYLYKVDTRLRPSGEGGPLVSSISTFEEYHKTSSRTWEKQALLKARVILGNNNLSEHLKFIFKNYIFKKLNREKIKQDILEMRKKMHIRESGLKKGYNIKLMDGGIVDIEFIVQFLQLTHCEETPEIFTPSTISAIEKLKNYGIIEDEMAHNLISAYIFFRDIERALRLYYQREEDMLNEDVIDSILPIMKRKVENLNKEIENNRNIIRRCYRKVFYGE
jgi:glutamate-ammonia-ligase adenylyltransferase